MLRSESKAEIADGELQDLLERVTLSGEELPEGLRATFCKTMSPINIVLKRPGQIIHTPVDCHRACRKSWRL